MLDAPVSGALPIVAEEVVPSEPPMAAALGAPGCSRACRDPRARVHACPGPRVQPAATSVSKPAPRRKARRPAGQPDAASVRTRKTSDLSIQLMGASSLDAVAQFVRVNRLSSVRCGSIDASFTAAWYVVLKGNAGLSQAQRSPAVASPAEGGALAQVLCPGESPSRPAGRGWGLRNRPDPNGLDCRPLVG